MCGIVGWCGPAKLSLDELEETVRRMADSLQHRGPDDCGVWVDQGCHIGLGHRRLSILDLSPLGHQPMESACGRYVITYNGEVYNHLELRKDLGDYPFRSTSDTETILAAISAWGLEKALCRFVGMFAFGLWDRSKRVLSLVRDRLGIKPLYYGYVAKSLVFGSELKVFREAPGFDNSVNRDALSLFFRHNYIPAPYSIYENIGKLEPGCFIQFDENGLESERGCYWSARDVWQSGLDTPFLGDESLALEELNNHLTRAVSCRMLSDVPLGAFLSGGIDSSIVAAIMQAHSHQRIRTFSIGFHEESYNEAKHAKSVAAHLGTDHTELYVTPEDLLSIVPSIPRMWDEPFADSSQIPTYLLSKMTKEHVTVSLSGDGGDELFSGYQRYFWMERWNRVVAIPRPLRLLAAKTLKKLPNSFFKVFGPLGPKIRWRADILGATEFADFYRYFVSHFKHPSELVLGAREPQTPLTNKLNTITDERFAQMSLWDVLSYLPDDILTKVDRASMAVGLEARVPLLDHVVVEFAARLPLGMKVSQGNGKWLLRELLYRYVPRQIVERPKMGFGVPIERWLRNELREWCGDLLSQDVIRRQGFLDSKKVGRMWNEYLQGEANWHYYLWDVLMFQAWLEEWQP